MIFLDPTEIHSNSRVAKELQNNCLPCENFEAVTGADLLISPLSKPAITNLNTKIGEIALKKHLDVGAVLVQRKSGPDILNFITDHKNIFAKMRAWTTQPWLLTVGSYTCDEQGKLVVDGQRAGGSEGWSYWSYWGALRAWQIYGGYVDNIHRDAQLLDWVQKTLHAIEKSKDDVLVAPKKPSQTNLISSESVTQDGYERNACIMALCTIDGVSVAKAAAITDYCGGKLKDALRFLSDPEHLKLKKNDEQWPKGIASSVFANAARWLGLECGGENEEQWREVLEVLIVKPYAKKNETAQNEMLDLPW